MSSVQSTQPWARFARRARDSGTQGLGDFSGVLIKASATHLQGEGSSSCRSRMLAARSPQNWDARAGGGRVVGAEFQLSTQHSRRCSGADLPKQQRLRALVGRVPGDGLE